MAKFNLKGLTEYQMELIRFCLQAHAENLEDILSDVDLTRTELTSTYHEHSETCNLINEISEMLSAAKTNK